MIRFNCDYLEGTHPAILQKLQETNMEQHPGYGQDEYCVRAKERIKELCGQTGADVHFLVGGTQTNLTIIACALRPHQGVLAPDTAHIACHETGAIEATGHKVLILPNENGKITGEQVREAMRLHRTDANFEHFVQPKMVYISFPTELGSIYSRSELEDLSAACHEEGLYLYLDGARLGYGLCSEECDLDMACIAKCCDAFYIGGTKMGMLFGEAAVIINDELKPDFRYIIKQKGGMLAKGRLLGIQFLTMFEDGLYFELGRHAIDMAHKLKAGIERLNIPFYSSSPTNQQFLILPDDVVTELEKDYGIEIQERMEGGKTAIRLCTSWATKEENVDKILADMERLLNV